jgi:hypothetical protein
MLFLVHILEVWEHGTGIDSDLVVVPFFLSLFSSTEIWTQGFKCQGAHGIAGQGEDMSMSASLSLSLSLSLSYHEPLT